MGKKQAMILEAKKNNCKNCGESDPHLLEFHHRDPRSKIAAISRFRKKYAVEQLREELAKCDVLCANCHRRTEREKIESTRKEKYPSPDKLRRQRTRELRRSMADASPLDYFTNAEVRTKLESEFYGLIKRSSSGCWTWLGSRGNRDTPVLNFLGRSFSAAKISFTLKNDFFPEGHVRRSCETKHCLNPDHLNSNKTTARKQWRVINATLASRHDEIDAALRDPARRAEIEVRFLTFISIDESGHWTWTGGHIRGFPHFQIFGNPILAKRISLGIRLERLPLKVKTLCGIKHCLCPTDLEERNISGLHCSCV